MAEFSSEYLQSLKQSLFPLILDTDPGMELVSPSAMIDHSTFNDNPIGYNALFSHPASEFPGNLAETVPALFSHHTNHLHEHASGSLVQPGMMMSGGDGDGESHHNKKRKPSDVSQSSSANSSAPPAFDNGRKQKHSRAKKIKGNVEKESEEGEKEVVHVRARRGQATDSHSLAERVRRGKINERLKCLQDIVPGCYKTMGLAVMLDEIINYVQSLQHQVEFLSMKLTAASTFYDFNSESDAIEKMQRAKVFEAKELERLIREGQGQGGHQHQQHPLLRPTWHS